MLAEKRLIVMLGLSRGGTNHLAQRLHACEGVVGFTEGMSRLIHPIRSDARQIMRREAIEAAVLKPFKSPFESPVWSFNKVNYALQVYPEAWVEFLRTDANTSALLLLRHPLMIHQSRVRYVRDKKPQRTRWLNPEQLAREWLELLAAAWRLPNAILVFHEHALIDNHDETLRNALDLVPRHQCSPTHCQVCRAILIEKKRTTADENPWLYCPSCERFIEGEGDYNFLRTESNVERCRSEERNVDAELKSVAAVLSDVLGRQAVDFFREGGHWEPNAAAEFRPILNADADRWNRVPLNEILYPY